MTGFESVLISCTNGIGRITLNRPEKLNAFAGTMREEVAAAVRQMAGEESVRVLIITGAGRAFCAGADVEYMRKLVAAGDVDSFKLLVEAGREVITAIRATPKPVIASINGPAAGGGANMALACDYRIASERASIGQTFTRIGLHPDWGGTYLLPRLVGQSKALELMFSGEMVDAQEALSIGMFNEVVPHDRLTVETDAYAMSLARKPPIALALIKRAVYWNDGRGLAESLDMELEHQLRCFKSQDATEGLQAFLDKRTPIFHGH
jgi:enoyl-CoA hydratase/carnithine racemase